ncbi:MAG: Ig-like domain-containing protein, partial [Mycobacterium sp.]|nr:Ig-like domain-containing protein [Mycobacterium sp.]
MGTATVSGNGTYHPSAGYTPTVVGDYWWYTSFPGDSNNSSAVSACGSGMSETVISAAAASQLAFGVQPPSNTFAGVTMSPSVTVQVEDAYGNPVSDNNFSITLTPSAGSIASGGVESTNSTGLATFPVVMNTAGANLTLTAAPTSAGTGVGNGTSNFFTISVLLGSGSILTDGATDAGSGVKSVAYYYCANWTGSCTSSNWTAVNSSSSNSSTTAPYSVAWSSNLPSSGDYQVVAVGTDNVNNVSSPSSSTPVTVDVTPPSVSIAFPTTGSTYNSSTWTGTLTGAASDSISSITNMAVAIENTTTNEWWNGSSFAASSADYISTTGTTSWSYGLAASSLTTSDTYNVTAQATDAAGNVGSATSAFTYLPTNQTVNFTTSGSYTLHVPAHVTSIGFTLNGAGGGGGAAGTSGNSAGAAGGTVSGTITIPNSSSASSFTVVVGGGGSGGASGSPGTGGAAGTGGTGCAAGGAGGQGYDSAGGGGGGATCIYLSGAPVNTIVEVGGGGGGGGYGNPSGANGGVGSGGTPGAAACGTSTGTTGANYGSGGSPATGGGGGKTVN